MNIINSIFIAANIGLDVYKKLPFFSGNRTTVNHSKVDKKVKALIRPIVAKFGIDPAQIRIRVAEDCSFYECSGSIEGKNVATLYIDQEEHDAILTANKVSAKSIFCIGHELGHLVHNHTRAKEKRKEERNYTSFGVCAITLTLLTYYNCNVALSCVLAKLARISCKWLLKNTVEAITLQNEEFESDLFAATTTESCEGGISFFTALKEKRIDMYHSREAFCKKQEGVFWDMLPLCLQDIRRGLNKEGEMTELTDRTHPPLHERISKLQARLALLSK